MRPHCCATLWEDQARGAANFVAALQVAQLALKHRKNKNGGQRVVMFVGSPLAGVEEKRLVRVGKQLKKNNIALDVVSMGECDANADQAFRGGRVSAD